MQLVETMTHFRTELCLKIMTINLKFPHLPTNHRTPTSGHIEYVIWVMINILAVLQKLETDFSDKCIATWSGYSGKPIIQCLSIKNSDKKDCNCSPKRTWTMWSPIAYAFYQGAVTPKIVACHLHLQHDSYDLDFLIEALGLVSKSNTCIANHTRANRQW